MTAVPKPPRGPQQACPRCHRPFGLGDKLYRHVTKCRKGAADRLGSRAVKEKAGGYTWDSALERKLYQQLRLRGRLGELQQLRVKPRVTLTLAQIVAKPDFSAWCTTSHRVEYFEAKGYPTERWKMIQKLWPWYGPGPLHVYVAGTNGEPAWAYTIATHLVEDAG